MRRRGPSSIWGHPSFWEAFPLETAQPHRRRLTGRACARRGLSDLEALRSRCLGFILFCFFPFFALCFSGLFFRYFFFFFFFRVEKKQQSQRSRGERGAARSGACSACRAGLPRPPARAAVLPLPRFARRTRSTPSSDGGVPPGKPRAQAGSHAPRLAAALPARSQRVNTLTERPTGRGSPREKTGHPQAGVRGRARAWGGGMGSGWGGSRELPHPERCEQSL